MDIIYHSIFCCGNSALYLHVCLVYQPCYQHADKNHVHAVPVFHGRTIPDGNVYSFQDCKHPETEYPWGLIIIYLGYGAGLAVFMFSGFVKSIPIEIEEAAMIDGCTPIQTFLKWFFRL